MNLKSRLRCLSVSPPGKYTGSLASLKSGLHFPIHVHQFRTLTSVTVMHMASSEIRGQTLVISAPKQYLNKRAWRGISHASRWFFHCLGRQQIDFGACTCLSPLMLSCLHVKLSHETDISALLLPSPCCGCNCSACGHSSQVFLC